MELALVLVVVLVLLLESGNDQEQAYEPQVLQHRSQELFNSSQLSRANRQRITLPPRGTASSI